MKSVILASLMMACAAASAAQQRGDPIRDLRSHVEPATGPQPADCGQHGLVRSDDGLGSNPAGAAALERSLGCATETAALRKPFWTFAQRQGIDSWLAEGLFGASDGIVHRFLYDSAPCGGPGCAGKFTAVRCDNPVVVVVGQDAIARYRCDSTVPPRVDTFVRAEMARQKVPGVAIAIVMKGTVLAKGYGLANVEHQVPVSPETIFQSGSLGKQFTAAAVMLLVEQGKIGLEDPATKFFPDAPASWRAITVRHLLTHTSGIPDYEDVDGGPASVDLRRDYTEEQLSRFAFNLTLEFIPGSRWNYSNTGYVLLGVIIHKVSGQFYGDLLRERVFAPLGMSTARIISEADIVPHRAAGYRLDDGALKNQHWVSPTLNTTADGALYLSVRDLIAWDQGLRSGAILSARSWEQVYDPVKLNSGNRYPYGFGWSVDTLNGSRRLHHSGSWQGFKSYLSRYLGEDLTIIVLANLAESDPGRFVDGIAGVLVPALAPAELTAIPDREPDVRARLDALLRLAKEGRLSPAEFAYVRAGFFPAIANGYQERLSKLGEVQQVSLLERKVLGDDRVYTYELRYAAESLIVSVGLAPDGKLSLFSIRSKPPRLAG